MKKLISLAAASLAIAVFAPTEIQAQTSMPTSPTTAPNEVTPPSGTTGMPSESTVPSTTPSAKTQGTCPMLSSSAGASTEGASSSSTYSTSSDTNKTSSSTTSNTMTADTTTTSTANPDSPSTAAGNEFPRLLDASSDQIEYNNLIGPTHYVKLAVGSSPLCYLSMLPLQDVYATDSIKVLDQSGNAIPAVVTKQDNGGAKISFEQPISAGSNLTVALQGVEYASSLTPTTVQYSFAGRFADYDQEIPYGIAQVQRFLR
jgi:hypothetical protein